MCSVGPEPPAWEWAGAATCRELVTVSLLPMLAALGTVVSLAPLGKGDGVWMAVGAGLELVSLTLTWSPRLTTMVSAQ